MDNESSSSGNSDEDIEIQNLIANFESGLGKDGADITPKRRKKGCKKQIPNSNNARNPKRGNPKRWIS